NQTQFSHACFQGSVPIAGYVLGERNRGCKKNECECYEQLFHFSSFPYKNATYAVPDSNASSLCGPCARCRSIARFSAASWSRYRFRLESNSNGMVSHINPCGWISL